jgi:tRNA uridine 5-carboxymethylaminomethyl modification enzyme
MKNFDIVILGGGHAGIEAAWISHQFKDLMVGIITMPEVPIGSAPCNPAVGGVGKGQVVREIDALGGLMGRLADLAGIQYRTLNESKGYAVQSTRVQIDKELYSKNAEEIIESSSIEVIRDRVSSLAKTADGSFEISGEAGTYSAAKLIVTTGTFLNGRLHTGSEVSDGGRVDCRPSSSLKDLFSHVKTLGKRFKTGTPPRLLRRTIDFAKMEEQESDSSSLNFHREHAPLARHARQVSCYLTRTNDKTLGLIRANKEKSPIFNGQIEAIGPRYCPSIEDKAFRYEEKNVHHVFVEPEGLGIDTFYPNGISTSLPKDIQQEFIQTIDGLESAEIEVFGYAVEYDVVSTRELSQTLEYLDIPGLYFAGQVCGTSGYEEAAGQGLVAGVNAALSLLGRDPLVIDRSDSYIGVMIEDLVVNDRDEPYRLFTARSENRLYIREDNSVLRMGRYRSGLLLNSDVDIYNAQFEQSFNKLVTICDQTFFLSTKKDQELLASLGVSAKGEKLSLAELLQRSEVDPVQTLTQFFKSSGLVIDQRVIRAAAISIKYRGYIKRNEVEQNKIRRLAKKSITWSELLTDSNISFECKKRIEKIRPETFGQLQRIEGIRPATLSFVASHRL